jgi:hypothetical protein
MVRSTHTAGGFESTISSTAPVHIYLSFVFGFAVVHVCIRDSTMNEFNIAALLRLGLGCCICSSMVAGQSAAPAAVRRELSCKRRQAISHDT